MVNGFLFKVRLQQFGEEPEASAWGGRGCGECIGVLGSAELEAAVIFCLICGNGGGAEHKEQTSFPFQISFFDALLSCHSPCHVSSGFLLLIFQVLEKTHLLRDPSLILSSTTLKPGNLS